MSIESSSPAADSKFKTEWWTPWLAGPVIVAAIVRLALLAVASASLFRKGIDPFTRGDTPGYLEPGRNLLLHGSFVAAGRTEIIRTPGYPLFLALTGLFGAGVAALLQVILSALTVVLVWRLARAVFNDGRIALIAAWIFAFEPLSIFNSVLLQSETLFLVLFLLSLERLVQFLRSRRLRELAAAGLWLAAATFVRPVTYYLPAALALGLFVVLARAPGLRWKAPCVLLISVLPWLAAWQIRNRVETGCGAFSAIAPRNLYFYEAAEVTARAEHRPIYQVMSEFGGLSEKNYLAAHPEQAGWSQTQRLAFMQSETSRILRRHVGIFLESWLRGSVRVAFSPGADDLMVQMGFVDSGEIMQTWKSIHDRNPLQAAFHLAKIDPLWGAVNAVAEILLLGTYFLAVMGIMRGNATREGLGLLLGVALYFIAASGGAQAGGRYRMPVMPILCTFAAAGAGARKQSRDRDLSALRAAQLT